MKRNLLIFLVCTSLAFLGNAEAMNTGTLTNAMDRTISLRQTFFDHFSSYSNALVFGSYEDFLRTQKATTLDAVWYTGYEMNTESGVVQQGTLAKGYSDLFGALYFDNFSILAGMGGFRYGSYVTGIRLNVSPAGLANVTDFTGSQTFQDIFALNFAWNKIFWFTSYFMTNFQFAPKNGLIGYFPLLTADLVSMKNLVGFNTQVLNLLSVDVLLSTEFEFQTLNLSIDPVNIILLCTNNPINPELSVFTGIDWNKQTKTSSNKTIINWDTFLIPLSGTYVQDKWSIFGEIQIASTKLKEDNGSYFPEFLAEGTYDITKNLKLGLGLSFYTHNAVSFFGNRDSSNKFGFNVYFSTIPTTKSVLDLSLGWRYNYAKDLSDLPEVTDKHILYINISYKLPSIKDCRKKIEDNTVAEINENSNENISIEEDIDNSEEETNENISVDENNN